MNLNNFIPLASAIVAAIASFMVGKLNSSSSNEGIYAEHYGQLLDKIDYLTDERDEYKKKYINLQEKIEKLNKQIKELKKEVNNGFDQKC